MTNTLPSSSDPHVCRVTLLGPAARPRSRSLLSFRWGAGPEWRKLIVQLQIGTERCPDWDHANLCLTAIQDLVKLSDGFLTDEVIDALRTHMEVVTYETFHGPPR